jgi:hypothetical protein
MSLEQLSVMGPFNVVLPWLVLLVVQDSVYDAPDSKVNTLGYKD